MNIYQMKKPKRFNSVSVSMAVALVVFGYLLYWWVPILWPIFQMTGIMKSTCNYAYRTFDDRLVMKHLVEQAARTRLQISEDNFRYRRIEYTPDERRALKIDDSSFVRMRGKRCEIDFHYEDDYPIPFLGRSIHLVFERSIEAPLETVQYDKMCTCVRVPEASARTVEGPEGARP